MQQISGRHTLLLVSLLTIGLGCGQEETPVPVVELSRTASAEGASVYIISPADSAQVNGDAVTVKFGLKGMGVAPAGVDFPDTGHHHLLVDVVGLPPMDLPIPADANHVHFGKGQTEATLQLEPGTHTLQLLLGDRLHIPHDPPVMSETITITVE